MGKRQEARDRIEAQIVHVGRRHLAADGAAGLSLRAIARELGMVSSAVYRYVSSRDDLLTLLLVDAYDDLADAVDAAARTGDWDHRLVGLARAARAWALDQPARWALLYGSPVPGYHAPPELTVGPGTRVIATLLSIVAEGVRSGAVGDSGESMGEPISSDFDGIRAEFGFTGGDRLMLACLSTWATVVGAISLEVFGQYGADTLSDPGAVFDAQLGLLVRMMSREFPAN
ncbi:TetR/AcrR family transcriptional regulator [Mycolicibacterium sp. 22603]|uniref:TetR/AcrR family transcriptional regulator n=1 Tax=Mycolicibacterium sp. 22603 TaxID=3453950 RepID=UPI003F86A70D